MSDERITTSEALNVLAVGTGVIDRDGDVWTRREDGDWESLETASFGGGHIIRKWGPLRLLNYRPQSRTPAVADVDAITRAVTDLADELDGWTTNPADLVERLRGIALLRGEPRGD